MPLGFWIGFLVTVIAGTLLTKYSPLSVDYIGMVALGLGLSAGFVADAWDDERKFRAWFKDD
jgi:hypothetical protein